MRRFLILWFAVFLVVPIRAEDAKPAAAPAPALSTEESLRYQIVQLQMQVELATSQANSCQGQLGQWRAKAMSDQLTADEGVLKSFVEKNHVGFTWDPKTGAFAKVPDPPKAPEKQPQNNGH